MHFEKLDYKVLVINESTSQSILTDCVTFGAMIICFFVNYYFLGDSSIIKVLIAIMMSLAAKARISVKRMNGKEALEYLKAKLEKN